MRNYGWIIAVALSLVFGFDATSFAEDSFAKRVGRVAVGDVKAGTVQIPYITWGGDVATFHANGGLTTKKGSIFHGLGLDMKLTAGDDFTEQVRRYLRGDSPFLRGTMRMMGLASEVIGRDPRTRGVVFLQLTWSAGDHMVGRSHVKELDTLEGKKVVLQRNGPHVGMLDDILQTAQLGWDDIKVVWVDELTGDNGPAARFRSDPSIDACMVITPDMLGLTGGVESKGSGAEGTVKDARVVVSTQNMSKSIADVYVCRRDFFDKNRGAVEKFVAGYLRGCEEVVEYKREFEKNGRSARYKKVLQLTQDIYGRDVIPTLEVDAHGLIADCTYVGLPGNNTFFTQSGNTVGFKAKQKAALRLAKTRGYANVEQGFHPPSFDYGKIATLGSLTYTKSKGKERAVAETVDQFPDEELDENTLLSFTISFDPDQTEFSPVVYGTDFKRTVEQAALFGNSVIAIRGHSDPTLTLVNFVRAGMAKGILKRTGSKGNWRYFYKGRPLSMQNTSEIIRLIESGAFGGSEHDPRLTMQAALNLSRRRAESVRDAIIKYAEAQGTVLDKSQIQPVGVGIRDPLVAKPRNRQEAGENRRVEFRLIRVSAEDIEQEDFDF